MNATPTEPDAQGRARQSWQLALLKMDSAPRDGTKFIFVQVVSVCEVGKPVQHVAYATTMRRTWIGEDHSGPGFWANEHTSVPDLHAESGYWIPLWGVDAA